MRIVHDIDSEVQVAASRTGSVVSVSMVTEDEQLHIEGDPKYILPALREAIDLLESFTERNERERGKGEDGGECVIGLASTVCAKGTLGCSKHRTPLPTEAPREDFPVPAKCDDDGACPHGLISVTCDICRAYGKAKSAKLNDTRQYQTPVTESPNGEIYATDGSAHGRIESATIVQPQARDVIEQVGFRWKVRDGSLWQRAEDGHWFEHASGQLARDIAEEAEAAIKAARNLGLEVRG